MAIISITGNRLRQSNDGKRDIIFYTVGVFILDRFMSQFGRPKKNWGSAEEVEAIRAYIDFRQMNWYN